MSGSKTSRSGRRLEQNGTGANPKLRYRILNNWQLYLLLVPVLAYYVVFHLVPMYGVLLAFQDYVPGQSMFSIENWVGLKHFKRFFESFYFERLVWNTISIRLFQIAIGFPAPIILAILLNEVSNRRFSKAIQNLTYIPHFFSTVVIVSVLQLFCQSTGIFNTIRHALGLDTVLFLQKAEWFKPLFVYSGVWQNMGWNAMIYLGAIAGIDPALYEAASIDGASRLRKMVSITLPCLMPTILIMLIMNLGSLMNVGFDKALLMQNDLNKQASDIISTFVYQRGVLKGDYGFATAVGLFNSMINVIMLVLSNKLSKLVSGSGLW